MQNQLDTLYYDGLCPLCTREIYHLEKLADRRLALVDIHSLTEPGDDTFPTTYDLLQQLHLRTAEGYWITGVDASVRAWSHTRLGFLWKPLSWPVIKNIAGKAYQVWANKRYGRLYGESCQLKH